MTDSRKKNGFVGIANQIWDEVIRRDFTKRQKDILLFLWRLSYGCNQATATVPMLKDFSLCGVGKTNITNELKFLENCKVIDWNRGNNEFSFIENFEYWQVSPVRGWDNGRFKELIGINLAQAKNKKGKVIETITEEEDEELSNQEPSKDGEVIETITENGNELLKQEPKVIELITVTPLEPIQDAASGAPKDNIKTLKDKDNKDMVISDFDTFWSTYPKKTAKKAALNMWERAIKAKVDPSLLVQCSENYAAHCKVNRTEDSFIMHGSTFLNPKNERYADFTEAPKQTTVIPLNKGQGSSRLERNKSLLQQRMEEARHEQARGNTHSGSSGYRLPSGGNH